MARGAPGTASPTRASSLLIEPYLSRVPLRTLLSAPAGRCPTRSSSAAISGRRGARSPACDLVGHTHFDHAVDAPAIARRYGTKAYGSASLAHLMRLHGLRRARGRGHAPRAPGARPVRGPLRAEPPLEADPRAARCRWPASSPATTSTVSCRPPTSAATCGGSGSRSAGVEPLSPGQRRPRRRRARRRAVDVFLAGVAGRGVTPRYWERILPRLDPAGGGADPLRQLLRPARGGRGLRPRGQARRAAASEIGAVSGDARIAALPRIDRPAGGA